jgi:hypothetical protein
MRASKASDSPSGYDREVRPRGPRAQRVWPGGVLGDAMHAISARWSAEQLAAALEGRSLLQWSSDELAAKVYTLGHLIAVTESAQERAELFELVGVYALAGVGRDDATAMLDPAAGNEAA